MKKIIDNSDLLSAMMISDKSSGYFYLLQLVRRAKDHPGEKIGESAIAVYYIRSGKELQDKMPEIRNLSQLYDARAYINMSPKSFKTLQNNITERLVRNLTNDIIENPNHAVKSEAGKLKSKDPKWFIDIDNEDDYTAVEEYLIKNAIPWIFIPTMSYGHLLTGKFDSYAFEQEFPHIDLHKNSMGTMLYFEKEV